MASEVCISSTLSARIQLSLLLFSSRIAINQFLLMGKNIERGVSMNIYVALSYVASKYR